MSNTISKDLSTLDIGLGEQEFKVDAMCMSETQKPHICRDFTLFQICVVAYSVEDRVHFIEYLLALFQCFWIAEPFSCLYFRLNW